MSFRRARSPLTRILATLLVFAQSSNVVAAESSCTPGGATLDRGERLTLLLCGESLTADSVLTGLEAAGIDMLYRQNLRRCGPEDRRPGLFLEVQARPDATDGTLVVLDAAGEIARCELAIAVPRRTLVPAEPLRATSMPDVYRLRIATGAAPDLTGACAAGLRFPDGSGPHMELEQPASCDAGSISATVRVDPGPQRPARLLFTAQASNGKQIEAISHVEPPRPFFAHDMAAEEALYIDVNGVRTRYFDKGEGDVLLLVHGGQPSSADYNAEQWQQNIAGLAEHFRVIALDRIGQGYTANPADLDAYDRYYSLVVEHLVGFMDALDIRRTHLVGHSQGGWPVTRIALDHPERVASLTVVDSTMIGPTADASQAVRFYLYQQNELHPPDGETFQSIRRGMEMFTYTGNNVTQQRVERILELSRGVEYQRARAWFADSYMSPAHPSYRKLKQELWAELEAGALQVATLIIWGRQDPEGSFEAGHRIAERMRAAGSPVTFHAFEDAGHVAYMEYPEDFNRVLIEFIAGENGTR